MRKYRYMALLLPWLALAGCDTHKSPPIHYIANVMLVEMQPQGTVKERKDLHITLCFMDEWQRMLCSKPLKHGTTLDIMTPSRSLALISADISGVPDGHYAFALSDAPAAKAPEGSDAVFFGDMLFNIHAPAGKMPPDLGIFTGCMHKDKAVAIIQKRGTLKPDATIAAECLNTGMVIKDPEHPVSLIQLIPHVPSH